MTTPLQVGSEPSSSSFPQECPTVTYSVRTTQASPFPCRSITQGASPMTGDLVRCLNWTHSCHTNGSLVLLLMPISRTSQNVLRSVSHSVSISIMDPHPSASRPRVSLIGNVTIFSDVDAIPDEEEMKTCYTAKHPDARRWLPGPREPHVVRSQPTEQLSRLTASWYNGLEGVLGKV